MTIPVAVCVAVPVGVFVFVAVRVGVAVALATLAPLQNPPSSVYTPPLTLPASCWPIVPPRLYEPPVLGVREGGWLEVNGDAVGLAGNGARLFRRRQAPLELLPGARIDALLAEALQ